MEEKLKELEEIRKQIRALKAREKEIREELNRGETPVEPLNPLLIILSGEAELMAALEAATVEQLKATIKAYALDPAKQMARTKDKKKLENHILIMTRQRSKKGDCFKY